MPRLAIASPTSLAVLLLLGAAAPARAETECKDCWSAQCPKLEGLMPRCKRPKAPARPAAPAKAAPTKAAPAATREEACPAGKERSADTGGHCCWHGQLWANGTCRGMPLACPKGYRVSEQAEACELAPCEADRVRMGDGVTCCYPGQVVGRGGTCRGRPTSCPDHYEVKGETCSDEAYRAMLARPVPVRLESTPPGARVVLAGRDCLAPCTLELPRGLATGEAALEGFESQPLVLTVTGEPGQTLRVNMSKEGSTVSVETSPAGASVYLDDVAVEGVTPLQLQATPGLHRLGLAKSGYLRADLMADLKPGPNPTIKQALEVLALPPLVPVPGAAGAPEPVADVRGKEGLLKELADQQVPPDRKRELVAARPATEDLTPLLEVVEPPDLKAELCSSYARRVRPVSVDADLTDSFNDEVKGTLVLDGRDYAPLPFRGVVPSCTVRLQAREAQGTGLAEWRPPGGKLSQAEPNQLHFRLEGRGLHVSLSGTAEYGVHLAPPPDAVQVDLPASTFAFGGRLDYWGKVFHATLAVKASQLYKVALGGTASTPWAPAADLYLGFLVASSFKPARVWLAVDFGAWNLINPSARVSLVLSIFDIGFITVHGDAHYILPFLASDPSHVLGARTALQSIMLSAGASVGVGW